MTRLLIVIVTLLSFKVSPQSKIDSLEQVLQIEKIDSNKVNILLELVDEYRYKDPKKAERNVISALKVSAQMEEEKFEVLALVSRAELLTDRSSYDSAFTFFQNALSIAENINFDDGKSTALIGLGNAHTRKGNLNKGEEYLQLNIDFAKEIRDFEGVASSYNNLGNVFNERGEYKKAMEAYTEASKVNTQIGNEKNAGINMANIGLIHQKLANYNEAIFYFTKSDSLFRKFDFLPGQAFLMKNMGIVLRNQGKPEEALLRYQKALESYNKMGSKREISQVYQNIGNIYSDEKQSGEAVENYRRSLFIAEEIGDSINMAMASQALGQEYFYFTKLDSSEIFSSKAVRIAQNIGADLTEMDGYKTLSQVYYTKGNLRKAFDFRILYENRKDSLYTLEKRDLAEEIEAKYQNEQKTKEIALLASEKKLQTLQLGKRKNERNAIIAFALLILLLAVLLYNQYRIKQKSNKELQELNILKSNFFANISHEFRTPLTLIQGPIEHLEQNPEDKLDKEDIKMIRRNTNKVLGLVNQLLDLSRIDEGKLHLRATEGDVFKCLRTAAGSFNSYAAQRNMDYRVEVPDESLWASFDRDKLEKVFYNLISNAFKFCEDGEQVAVQVSFVEDELVIQVSDSGRGISEDKLPYIFDRFYQVDSSSTRDQEGSGIGLSLSKDLVKLMDGTITVSSEEGMGTYFTVQIPIERIKVPESKMDLLQPKVLGKRVQPKPFELTKEDVRKLPRLLVIEDNEDMRQFIKNQLLEKYRVMLAKNGKEGLKTAVSHMPDLIITDLMMPRMDGMELCEKLKTNLSTSHIPIIMLTARAGEENKIQGLETGADEYITKPFSAKELSARVKNLIVQRQRLRQHYMDNRHAVDPKKITTTSLDKKFLEQVLNLLEEKYSDFNFNVPQMQSELAISKTQLNRKLKALTGESPRDLLRNFRLKRAAQLLGQKADTVTQIAYQVGFSNLSYFAKCFKERYGVSPSSY
ncbi:tetratricopeptide repeat protein [Maribacter sp. PR1]|uniref:histidine kinase n=1 Tax=Maribacter cobaltidurans TaxID=1178778 RepID=A0ABU7IUF8_9FLAO|nr:MULTISPECIES: tetratricopeptide repeat protein [Maribacter]MDC6389223.1 tetratricopeptide repeat protein [Maribacter sp. PR1]MEE1976610.1 tetratricopeptide repeat protein [Maribacter cobaltidurans]